MFVLISAQDEEGRMESLQLGSSGGYVDEKGPVRQGVWKCRDCRWQFDGNGGNGFSRQQDPVEQVGDSHLSHGRFA